MGLKEIDQLRELERRFDEICDRLVYRPGSIFRVASQYLQNWGIEIAPENRLWIDERSVESYYREWKNGNEESNKAIEAATERAELPYGNDHLNQEVGFVGAQLIPVFAGEKKKLIIADIGAGAGDTTDATLDFLDFAGGLESVLSKSHFYLIEPSFDRLARAKEKLDARPKNKKLEVAHTLVASNHSNHLPMIGAKRFDVVISSAVFHHMSFPSYLAELHNKLAKDGIVIIGDWYTKVWSHPAFMVGLLDRLGASADAIEQFRFLFKVNEGAIGQAEKELSPYHQESNKKMIDYEVKIAVELQKVSERSKLFFLEAHESLEDRLVKLAEAGFETDIAELKKKHAAFATANRSIVNLYPGSDFATVVAAAKIPGHRPVIDRDAIKERISKALT